jgi:hypothetical protein
MAAEPGKGNRMKFCDESWTFETWRGFVDWISRETV